MVGILRFVFRLFEKAPERFCRRCAEPLTTPLSNRHYAKYCPFCLDTIVREWEGRPPNAK